MTGGEEEDSFWGDTEISVDSGSIFLYITVAFTLFCTTILICMLVVANRYDNLHKNDNEEIAFNRKKSHNGYDNIDSRPRHGRRRWRRRLFLKKEYFELASDPTDPANIEIDDDEKTPINLDLGEDSSSEGSLQAFDDSVFSLPKNAPLKSLRKILKYDPETKKLTKLMIPFVLQAAFTGLFDILQMVIIGRLIGTNELTAHVLVGFFVRTSSNIVLGFVESLATLCSQSIGVGNKLLTGQYVQIALIMYTIFFAPFILIWNFYTYDAIELLGFTSNIASIGQQYSRIMVFYYLLIGISECVHALLDVMGKEDFGTTMSILEELSQILTMFLVTFTLDDIQLSDIACIFFIVCAFFLAVTIIYIHCMGWFDPYLEGIIGSFALANKSAVYLLCNTALSLSFGYILTEGEWEIMAIFVSFLGPAEVAAWGIIGTIWDAIEAIVEAVGDAAEVRVAFLLGRGLPMRAKLSAYKSLCIAILLASVLASLLWTSANYLPSWLTEDSKLQSLVGNTLPILGIGIISLTIGGLCWTIVGAQGRYRLATAVVCFASWFFTLPFSALSSMVFRFDLKSQVAAAIAGYTVSGTINMYLMFRSDWESLSKTVIAANEEDESESDSNDDNDEISLVEKLWEHRTIPECPSPSATTASTMSSSQFASSPTMEDEEVATAFIIPSSTSTKYVTSPTNLSPRFLTQSLRMQDDSDVFLFIQPNEQDCFVPSSY